MTRINLVNVRDLADAHAMAEYREIKMIPPALRRSIAAVNKELPENKRIGSIAYNMIEQKIPKSYTLNTGHVTFFYNKLNFLSDRYEQLQNELQTRNFNISHLGSYSEFIADLNPAWGNDNWTPSISEIQVNIDRIVLRLNERPTFYRYHGDIVPPSFFEDRYRQQLVLDIL